MEQEQSQPSTESAFRYCVLKGRLFRLKLEHSNSPEVLVLMECVAKLKDALRTSRIV